MIYASESLQESRFLLNLINKLVAEILISTVINIKLRQWLRLHYTKTKYCLNYNYTVIWIFHNLKNLFT